MMYPRPEQPQQWSVHAEFTISHDGMPEATVQPQAHTEQDENGVRMVYSWTSQPMGGGAWGTSSNTSSQCGVSTPPQQREGTTSTEQPTEKHILGGYGFQRGNMLFTSTPPQRKVVPEPINKLGVNVLDSGYGSDLLSPNSNASTIMRRLSQYNRKCTSTCSIVLSTAYNENVKDADGTTCSRTQSLRCQTPTSQIKERRDSLYGCGDPWCHHTQLNDDFCKAFPPVYENEEYKKPSRASTYTPGVRPSPLRDACVQTFEMVDKCTSPFLKTDAFDYFSDEKSTKKRRPLYNARRRTEPIKRVTPTSVYSPDSLESRQVFVFDFDVCDVSRIVRKSCFLLVHSLIKQMLFYKRANASMLLSIYPEITSKQCRHLSAILLCFYAFNAIFWLL